jgi:Zn-dependent M28 family amino/carboxypeptidase
VVLLVGIAILVSGGWWLARKGILALPLMRRHGVNLEARRPGAEPVLWLVAHVDSKSQPVPLLVRAGGIVLLVAAYVFAIVLAIAAISGRGSPGAWLVVAILAIIGALPVLGSVVGHCSAGALDNASGLATVLTAASMLPRDLPIGVLITDAEELGLAGARAWCSEFTGPNGVVLNCDGVDDDGDLTLMWTRPRTSLVESAMRAAAAETGVPLRVIPLVPGVLVDGVAFSDAGWQSVTLSRGTLRTLRRIHTSADNLEHLRGDGITAAARVLARAAAILTERR